MLLMFSKQNCILHLLPTPSSVNKLPKEELLFVLYYEAEGYGLLTCTR